MSANEHLDSTCDLGHFVHCDGLLEAGSKFLESYDSLIVDTWEGSRWWERVEQHNVRVQASCHNKPTTGMKKVSGVCKQDTSRAQSISRCVVVVVYNQ